MNIKEIIDAERWQLKIPVSKIHNDSLDRIEAAVLDDQATLMAQIKLWSGDCKKAEQRIAELEAQLKNTKEHANAASSWLRRGWISKAAKEIEKIGGRNEQNYTRG